MIRDAIHDYIHIHHTLIWKLVNSKEMQRLRRIKQLGGTYQVFHSAEHSRFVHSLGVYQVVLRMLETECLQEALSDYDQICVMCAALLHDIGHGPFSHSFEGVFHESHEDMSVKMILQESEVHDILASFYYKMPNDVAMIIQHTHPHQVLIQMVSSQLDADRMDYLLRDSYMSGTTYGHFDMSRILRTMRICDGKIVYKESECKLLRIIFLQGIICIGKSIIILQQGVMNIFYRVFLNDLKIFIMTLMSFKQIFIIYCHF